MNGTIAVEICLIWKNDLFTLHELLLHLRIYMYNVGICIVIGITEMVNIINIAVVQRIVWAI